MQTACVQETRAPSGANLPIDQPYAYDGPVGVGGCEAGFLVHDTSSSWPVSLNVTRQRIRWRNIAFSGAEISHILICNFYAPHVGTELADRVSFWIQLRASIEKVLALHPRARLILAADSNIYLSEIMGCERERSGEPRLRELVRDFVPGFWPCH